MTRSTSSNSDKPSVDKFGSFPDLIANGGKRPVADVGHELLKYGMSVNVTSISQAREAIAKSAEAMLAGDLSYIRGARHICGLFDEARIDCYVELFVTFISVSSETDIVPFGWMRDNWHPETKAEHELQWQKAENWAGRALEDACMDLIVWIRDQSLYGS